MRFRVLKTVEHAAPLPWLSLSRLFFSKTLTAFASTGSVKHSHGVLKCQFAVTCEQLILETLEKHFEEIIHEVVIGGIADDIE